MASTFTSKISSTRSMYPKSKVRYLQKMCSNYQSVKSKLRKAISICESFLFDFKMFFIRNPFLKCNFKSKKKNIPRNLKENINCNLYI